jgi:hypothetical protein
MKYYRILFAAIMTFWVSNAISAPLGEVRGCGERQQDITEAANVLLSGWDTWTEVVAKQTRLKIDDCVRDRLANTGVILCLSTPKGKCQDNTAWTNPRHQKISFCPSLLTQLDAIPSPSDRLACYAAIMVQQFANSCSDNFDAGSQVLADATFDWYAQTHHLTIQKTDCRFQ